MTDDEWHEYLEDTHKAVQKYGKVEFEGLVRRAIYRLQRFPASGIYGNGLGYKTLWDEWCHEVQEGPHGLLESAWNHTLLPILEDVIGRVPQHARVLLAEYARWKLSVDSGQEPTNFPDAESLLDLLRQRVSEVAINRDIDRLGPDGRPERA